MRIVLRALALLLSLPIAGVQAQSPAPITLTKARAGDLVDLPLANPDAPTGTAAVEITKDGARECLLLTAPWTCTLHTADLGHWTFLSRALSAAGWSLGERTLQVTIQVQPPPPPPPTTSLAARVLVVTSTLLPASSAVAAHYMAARGIPAANLCPTTLAWPSWRAWNDYHTPDVAAALTTAVQGCVDRLGRATILYIVTTPGVPYRVWLPDVGGRAIDSALAALWTPSPTRTPNAYFTGDDTAGGVYPDFVPLALWREGTGLASYSVWRLWGTEADANALVDTALQVEADGGLRGRACLDAKDGKTTFTVPDSGLAGMENEILAAAAITQAAGLPTTLDVNAAEFGTAPAPLRCEGAAFVAGWYSYAHYNDAYSFVPGAVGVHADSGSWVWSVAALARGVIATSGTIEEPYLDALVHPDTLVRDLIGGATVGDAFWRHTRYAAWMTVQVGDPLYRPFPGGQP